MTLNVLLSFAQFEREVTGERIRDKVAASKKKGMWMGGFPPLGYDILNRKLAVNEAEAETVRLIYQRFLDLGSVRKLVGDMKAARHREQALEDAAWQSRGAAMASAAARSIIFCATRSMSARSGTRDKSARASTRRSCRANYGIDVQAKLKAKARHDAQKLSVRPAVIC